MANRMIYGIQQIGVGVSNADEAFKWYATRLGSDVPVFDDKHTATYMAPYMGGTAHQKRAILAMNMQGGGGYEIWQYLDREPSKSLREFNLGDLGINIAKVKSKDILRSYHRLDKQKADILSGIVADPGSKKCFYLRDPYENIIQVSEYTSWYADNSLDIGGIFGCTIGVTDIDKSLKLYRDILGYDKIIYDMCDHFPDLYTLPRGSARFRRILLGHQNNRTGGFSRLFGESQIELIQVLDSQPEKVFQNRFWGDLGFIHLCFDVGDLAGFVSELREKGFPFRVLSEESFNMGDANGRWGYFEDPDGTLIEFVETFKIPLIRKLRWNINLKRRDPSRPLPDWLIKSLSIKRVKFNTK
jgi:catechol 2,3-dioxygenase-like lactoylglutathione lyase family enzyme